MEKSVIKLVEEFTNSQLLKDYGDKIGNEIIKELDEVRETYDGISKRLQEEESRIWNNISRKYSTKYKLAKLSNLVCIYGLLTNINDSKYIIKIKNFHLKDLVNKE